ncbi:MAG: hypothetical protein SGILL_010105, partial [Bacillariaceae sp.]
AHVPNKTKSGKSDAELNANLVNYEQLIYNTQFVGLQGKYIPKLPSSKGPPTFTDENGYRLFVMERMEDTIESIVPMLLKNKPTSKSISVGPIAVRLLECVQAIHKCGNIVRDVKAENFMLARIGTKEKKSGTFEDKVAARIRLIDLALVAQYSSIYRSDKNSSGIIGTPLYASLNSHEGIKSSYRDDLESLGYVIAELLIKISSGDTSKKLPWSDGRSDDDIGSKKRALVEDSSSEFFKLLGDKKTAAVLSKYLTTVKGYSFKQRPDYEELADILRNLAVPRPKVSKTSSTAKKASTTRKEHTPTKRGRKSRTVATQTSGNEEESYPSKIPRRQKLVAGMDVDGDSDSSGVVEMDWQPTDENDEPDGDKKPRAKARKEPFRHEPRTVVNERVTRSQKKNFQEEIIVIDGSDEEEDEYVFVEGTKEDTHTQTPALKRRGVRIIVVGGPHKGESFDIEDSGNETIVIGSKPSTKVGTAVSLPKDKSMSATHLRLDLSLKKTMKPAVAVTNKSKDQVFVNSIPVKNTKAFIGNEIAIGHTVLRVDQL